MTPASEKFIDVRNVFHKKNPTLAALLPGFVYRFLQRIVHEDEMNSFIERKGHLRDLAFVDACIEEMGAEIHSQNLDFIPDSGGCIVASNHPLGGLDGLALMQVVGKRRKDIRFFVNDILLNLQSFGELFVGVNKHGKNPKENLRQMDEVFASDRCVLFFPAGLVSRRQNGKILDLEWKRSFVSKAVQHKKPIIPAYIGGKNSNFFYTFAHWRKKLGIKSNIEMFFLVDEMYKQRNHNIDFVFGPPIPPETFDGRLSLDQWAQRLKEYVYALAEGEKRPFAEWRSKDFTNS